MIRATRLALVALAGAALAGCAGAPTGDDRPDIVVTTNILGDVVSNLAGSRADVTVLMRPNADPHSFEISAQEAAAMSDADLLVSNGLGLEEGLQQHLDRAAAEGVTTFVAGDHVEVLAYASEEAGGADDPHFWTDPAQMLAVVDALEAELAALDGLDPERLEADVAAYRADLVALDEEMSAAFAEVPAERRQLVTNHHVFGYLAERFGFEIVGAVIPGGTTLAAPSASDLRGLTDAIRAAGVRTIFAESSQPDRLMQVLAEEAGIDVQVTELFTESLTAAGGGADTYLSMMRTNSARITEGLSR
ncbi:zinc ABC transporter substrate-binding protein AztC [Microbacterium sp. Marseille-Q6965]|uniref:zinc ABC transporter substrate-binding protein AztC n=1 Tax=Microbacterium sp. Marseille-Q6965 TaxID=2965072 RepID=UPI0021B7D86F|nr:zinc ABC transporter substrate-binding protein AztC [Microbacterium sp. Marseille-Q6965]